MAEEPLRIDRKMATSIVESFAPLFRQLNDHGTRYCVVGGLAVMMNGLAQGYDSFRATADADIMVDDDYTNAEFAHAYLDAYGSDPRFAGAVYDEVFGDGAFKELSKEDQRFVNVSIIGADAATSGVDTPDVDVVRRLDEETLSTLDTRCLEMDGVAIHVATPACLRRMKRYTMALMINGYHTEPRASDVIDLMRLDEMEGLG